MSTSAQNPEQRWEQLLTAAEEYIRAREPTRAREALFEAALYSEHVWGEDDIHLIAVLRLVAGSYWVERTSVDSAAERAGECLRRALGIARMRLNEDDIELARVLTLVGSSLGMTGLLDEACEMHMEAVEIARRNGREVEFCPSLDCIGVIRMEQGRHDEALRFFEREVEILARNDLSTLQPLATARFQLARSMLLVGRHNEALEQLEVAIQLLPPGEHTHLRYAIQTLAERARSPA